MATAAALAGLLAPAAPAQDVPFDADPAHTNAARQAKKFAHARRDARRRAACARSPGPAGALVQRRLAEAGASRRGRTGHGGHGGKRSGAGAYNVPNRDCSQYSAGGARRARLPRAGSTRFAHGIGDRRAAGDPRARRARRAAAASAALGHLRSRRRPRSARAPDRGLRRRRPLELAAGRDDGAAACARSTCSARRVRAQRLELPPHRRARRLRHAASPARSAARTS